MGGASVHIKGLGSTPIPLQRKISTEGIGAHYLLSMLRITMESTTYRRTLALQKLPGQSIHLTTSTRTSLLYGTMGMPTLRALLV